MLEIRVRFRVGVRVSVGREAAGARRSAIRHGRRRVPPWAGRAPWEARRRWRQARQGQGRRWRRRRRKLTYEGQACRHALVMQDATVKQIARQNLHASATGLKSAAHGRHGAMRQVLAAAEWPGKRAPPQMSSRRLGGRPRVLGPQLGRQHVNAAAGWGGIPGFPKHAEKKAVHYLGCGPSGAVRC